VQPQPDRRRDRGAVNLQIVRSERHSPRRRPAFVMLHGMRHLLCVAMGMLSVAASAQQPNSSAPASVGIVFDVSGSMGAKLARSREMVAQLMNTANPGDEFFLIQFSDRPVLASAFTTDKDQIQDRMRFIQSKGRSALWDAIYDAVSEARKGQNPRRALLVISDGGENSSRHSEREANDLVRQAGIPIYAVEIDGTADSSSRTTEELYGLSRLTEIAEHSGGRHFGIESVNDIPTVVAKINAEVRSTASIP
jgi:Ca-activated chloride channel family protein